MNSWYLYGLVFLAIFIFFFGLMNYVVNSRLASDITSSTGESNNVLTRSVLAPIIHYLANINSRQWCAEHREQLEKRLLYAGRPAGAMTAAEFMAGGQILALLVLVVFLALGVITGNVFGLGVIAGTVAAFVSYWFLTEYIQNLVTSRKALISRQFPSFLDLAVMSTKAGASFMETLEIYVQSNPDTALAVELSIVVRDISMGATLEESLTEFKQRIPLEPVRNATDAIVQGQNIGTPIASVLEDQADAIRFHRSQAAERAAEELKVKIMGPIVFMMIAVFLLILGPAVLEVMKSGVGS